MCVCVSLRRPRVSHIQDFDKVNPSNKTSRTGMNNSARPSLPHQDGVVVRKFESVCLGGGARVGSEKVFGY